MTRTRMRRLRVVFMIVAAASVLSISPPSNADSAHEVEVMAKKFAFDPPVIQVTAGESVRLVIRSADAVHGFAIHRLKIDVQIPRGAPVSVEFTAPPPGRYEIACSEFCGNGHGQMKAMLVSVAATEARR